MYLIGFSLAREIRDTLWKGQSSKVAHYKRCRTPHANHFHIHVTWKFIFCLNFPYGRCRIKTNRNYVSSSPSPPLTFPFFTERHYWAILKVSEQGKQGEIEPTVAKKNMQQTDLHQPPENHHISVRFRNHSLDWLEDFICIFNLFFTWVGAQIPHVYKSTTGTYERISS